MSDVWWEQMMVSWSVSVVAQKGGPICAQATHIALAPLHEEAREHDCLLRATALMERDAPGTARSPLSSPSAVVDERHFH